ncbi:MAG: hypothetical protein AzoDbin1_03443 [Azoarcus sp.]|nr:hypothetical protein [Aromatoleum toluolicum]MCK9986971.1 hypothetical protein [Azoarcus sp.]MCQ6963982.1 hypothetical protein [Aromatoleum toluolicum]
MLSIEGFSDLYADACVRGENGELLLLSLYGRDTSVLQFMSAFSVPRDQGGLLQAGEVTFTLADDGARHTVFVPEPERLQKFTGRFPDRNLFGSLTHTWLYDPVLVQLNRPGGTAWLVSDECEVPRSQLWALIRDLSPLPLLDHWRDPLLDGLGDRLYMPLSRFKFPPLGKVGGVRVTLEERFQDLVSMAVKQGVLTLEADDLPADAAGRIQGIAEALPPVRAQSKPLFELGRVVMTAGVELFLERHPDLVDRCLGAYLRGDWGVSSEPEQNDEAVRSGDSRIFAAYPIDPARPSAGYGANTLWLITEADRSVTTLLLPEEY